jgi:hypothetical protein
VAAIFKPAVAYLNKISAQLEFGKMKTNVSKLQALNFHCEWGIFLRQKDSLSHTHSHKDLHDLRVRRDSVLSETCSPPAAFYHTWLWIRRTVLASRQPSAPRPAQSTMHSTSLWIMCKLLIRSFALATPRFRVRLSES